MSTVLISFLGRVPRRDNGQYRTTRYEFPDGGSDESAFFGLSLQRRLLPRRLVILGTAGSVWDHLFERDVALGGRLETERLALMDSVAGKVVDQPQLDALAPALAEALDCETRLQLIPYGRTVEEQTAIARVIAGAVSDGDTLHLDITHAFRHLPMLATLAILFLRATRSRLKLGGVWYGSYDDDTGLAPVYDLRGLLDLAEWAEAMHRHDQDGDLGALSSLLLPALSRPLQRASYFDRTHQPVAAGKELDIARAALHREPLHGLGALIEPELRKRLARPSDRGLYQRHRRLAFESLGRADYLRAALYGFEARVTYLIERAALPEFRADLGRDRIQFMQRYYQQRGAVAAFDDAFAEHMLLGDLRNRLAHGFIERENREVSEMLASQDRLHYRLEELLTRLLPLEP